MLVHVSSILFMGFLTTVQSFDFPWIMKPCDEEDDSVICTSHEVCVNKTCLPVVNFGVVCDDSLQCRENDLVSCINNRCSCRSGMKRVRDECVPQSYCNFDMDCEDKQFCMRRLHKCSSTPPPAFFWTLGLGITLTIIAGILVSCFSSTKSRGVRLEIASAGHYSPVPLNPRPNVPTVRSETRRDRCTSDACDSTASNNDPPPPFEEPPSYADLQPLNQKQSSTL